MFCKDIESYIIYIIVIQLICIIDFQYQGHYDFAIFIQALKLLLIGKETSWLQIESIYYEKRVLR